MNRRGLRKRWAVYIKNDRVESFVEKSKAIALSEKLKQERPNDARDIEVKRTFVHKEK